LPGTIKKVDYKKSYVTITDTNRITKKIYRNYEQKSNVATKKVTKV